MRASTLRRATSPSSTTPQRRGQQSTSRSRSPSSASAAATPSASTAEASGEVTVEAPARGLSQVVEAAMREHPVPGVAVGLVADGEETVAGFGVTNVDHPLAVDGDTLFQIGSITKTVTATAIMRLVEARRPSPHAPLPTYLPPLRPPGEG